MFVVAGSCRKGELLLFVVAVFVVDVFEYVVVVCIGGCCGWVLVVVGC